MPRQPRRQEIGMIQVDLDISQDLENLIKNSAELAPNAVKYGLRKVAGGLSKKVKANIRSMGLVKSGYLAKSVRAKTNNKISVVGTKAAIANILENGAKPHEITIWKKKDLKVPFGGGYYYAKSVMHPGVRKYDFFDGAWENMQTSGEASSLFAMGVQLAIEEAQNNVSGS